MKTDILGRDDISKLVNEFYAKVKVDPQIAYFFTEIMHLDWNKHIPKMVDFWENVVFFTGSYQGNPMEVHRRLHKLSKLKASHFTQWTILFTKTVDEHFQGLNANSIKEKATKIANIIQTKLLHADKRNLMD